jgi:transaldolase
MTNQNIARLSEAGVSVWLDDLSRELTETGGLQTHVDEHGVVGVTSNPTIFAAALAKGERYAEQVGELARAGSDVDAAVVELTTTDVRAACDILAPVHAATGGRDGRVSLEVDPRLAHDTAATVESARTLWAKVDRPNLMIKIPATVEGLSAITTAVGEGISVNVTLIFSLDRYRAVLQAYLSGLEQAREKGLDLAGIASVASFFISRVDAEVDRRLDEAGTDEARGLRGRAALANARLAFATFEEVSASPRWQVLAEAGATAQRPLWASTGVKDPEYPDTLYISELVTDGVVNTMPASALAAFADHGEVTGDTVRGRGAEASATLDALERVGVSYADVVDRLEREGVEKFEKSWTELVETVGAELDRARAGTGHRAGGE